MKFLPTKFIFLLSFCQTAQAVITVSDFSTAWTPISGNYDYLTDQQTGQTEGDLVGLGTNYGFFIGFNEIDGSSSTDGQLLFRVRLDKAGGNNTPSFDRVVWIGIDADINGSLDAFIGLNRQGNSSEVGVYVPGSGANTSPNTTSIDDTAVSNIITATSSTNYNYRAVDFLNDGGTTNDIKEEGTPDYYVSFMIPFADLVNFLARTELPVNERIAITDQSPLRYVMATSTQTNSLNQDLGGINGGFSNLDKVKTWDELGGFSPTASLVPEPGTFVLILGSVAPLLLRRRRS